MSAKARYGVMTIAVAAASLFLVLLGSLPTSALAGVDAAQKLENRAFSAAFWGAAAAVLGLVPWKAASEGRRGPWRAVALSLFAVAGMVAVTTIAGITVPH